MTQASYGEHDRRVWEDIFTQMPETWYDAPASDVMDRCQAFFAQHAVGRLLDVGCGFGRWAAYLAGDTAAAVVGIDYAVGGIVAAHRYVEQGLPVRFAAGSALALPVASDTYDGVLSALLLDNLSRADAAVAMAEINRVTMIGAAGFFVFNPLQSPHAAPVATNPTAKCMHVNYPDDELDEVLGGWHLTVRDVSTEGFRVRAGVRAR